MESTGYKPELLFNGPRNAASMVVLAHGAGAAMDTDFMEFFAKELAKCGVRVARFEFRYMAARRKSGKRPPPDREPVLKDVWQQIIKTLGPNKLIIGGKSMGGRIASLVADEAGVAGLAVSITLCFRQGPLAFELK